MPIRMLLLPLIFAVLCHFLPGAGSSGIKGPPHVSGEVDPEQTARAGDVIRLQCPIRAEPPPIIEWFKDGEPITAAWMRFRSSGSSLRIRPVETEDGGVYVCKGVNGFGWKEVAMELKVTNPEGEEENAYPRGGGMVKVHEKGPVGPGGTAPQLVEVSPSADGSESVLKPAGSTLRLKCVADGSPPPEIVWFKNGQVLMEELSAASQVAASVTSSMTSVPVANKETRRTRSLLHRHHVTVADSGLYVCSARNFLGEVSASFPVEVVDKVNRKPELEGVDPMNTTVEAGNTATLLCRVRSEVPPDVRWLKRLSTGELPLQPASGPPPPGHPGNWSIEFDGFHYQVLPASEVVAVQDGAYLNKLSIMEARPQDSGVYLCLAVNPVGYNFRQAALSVQRPFPKNLSGIFPSSQPHPYPDSSRLPDVLVYVVVPVLLCSFLATGGVCFLRKRRKGSSTNPPPAPAAPPPQHPTTLPTIKTNTQHSGTQTPEVFLPTSWPYYHTPLQHHQTSSPEYAYPRLLFPARSDHPDDITSDDDTAKSYHDVMSYAVPAPSPSPPPPPSPAPPHNMYLHYPHTHHPHHSWRHHHRHLHLHC